MSIKLTVDTYSEAVVIHLNGRFTYEVLPLFKEQVVEALKDVALYIILDFENVRYIDSSGLGALIFLLNQTKKYNKKLLLVSLSPSVMNVFEQTKLQNHITIYDNLEPVLEKIKKGEPL